MNDDFEQRLSSQPLRRIPEDWKAGMLAPAGVLQSSVPERRFSKTVLKWMLDLLWPSPVAWAGVAVVWIGIAVMNQQALELAESSAAESYPATPEMIIVIREQTRSVQAMLDEDRLSDPWDRPRPAPAPPRETHLPFLLMTS